MRYLNVFIYCTMQHIYLKTVKDRKKKMQKLKFKDPKTEQTVIAKWSDLIYILKLKIDSFVKLIKLNYATLYPSDFETQKVSLAINIFNEKKCCSLELNVEKHTVVFVNAVANYGIA